MIQYAKRLIEVDLPIKEISAHAQREKSIRHGHISTLHIWWARRPLAACRAVICAALWPDPADENCPQAFRDAAAQILVHFAEQVQADRDLAELVAPHWSRWQRTNAASLRPDDLACWPDMRYALLDFIADFANWDASRVPAFLEASRALTQAAHEALAGIPGTRPLVVDPFAGGGAIPLEALRAGADAFASDLNPVAVLLNKVVLEYVPKYGKRLAKEVRKWGGWVKRQADRELAEFYPKDPDGATPIAYLWARTIISEAPDDGTGIPLEVPLIRSMWLAKKKGRYVALRWVRNDQGHVQTETVTVTYADGVARIVRRPLLEIFEPQSAKEVEDGTVARGAATCPVTGYTTPVESVRRQLKKRKGGTADARLYAVATTRPNQRGRFYRLPHTRDLEALSKATEELKYRDIESSRGISLVPDEQISLNELRRISVPIYGMVTWGDLFISRQALALAVLAKLVKNLDEKLAAEYESDLAKAIQACLALAIDKQADLGNALCPWEPIAECPRHLFSRQAIGIVWDFAEGVVTGESSGAWKVQVDRMRYILDELGSDWSIGHVELASATVHPLPDDAANAVITDPPYYDAVPYAHLSDFFYVWLRRSLRDTHSDLFKDPSVPKEKEIVVDRPHKLSNSTKGIDFYERELTKAFSDSRRLLRPDGIGTIVFASKTTASWEAILRAIVDAGWTITGSWPIDTEMQTRIAAQGQARLASSVHLVCRPREAPDGSPRAEEIGDWRDILQELPQRVHTWLPRLAREGVVGADAIFACLGPALEIYSRYSRVEKASGEGVTLTEYLEYVWAAVAREALTMVFEGADATGFEEDARLTAMWLWTLSTGDGQEGENGKEIASAGYTLEYDAARKIAQGLGAHLEKLEHLVEIKGDRARLLPVSERARYLFGTDAVQAPTRRRQAERQLSFLETLGESEAEAGAWGEMSAPGLGHTTLDRVHQSMLLFAAGRGEALKRFLVEEGAGRDERFWRLAQALSALYPTNTDEKRWVDGVLARKKGLGF